MFWHFLQPFFIFSGNTWAGQTIRESQYLFPIISVVHLGGLAVLLGAVLILNLRIIGVAMSHQPLPAVAQDFGRWILASFGVMVISGWLMLTSEAAKCFESGSFQVKMACLLAAIVIQFTVYRGTVRSIEAGIWQKLAAVLSLMLWFSVGLAGRAVGYL
jgi:hypothetical protein